MHGRRICGLVAVGVCLASVLKTYANGFLLGGQDAFATARGGAVVATPDNASTVYYNPAGISQLEGVNFRGGFTALYFDPTYTPPPPRNTNTFKVKDNWAAVPAFFATYSPKEWPLSFGLGLYSPYGGKTDWGQDTGFRSVAVNGSLTYVTLNPVVSLKVAPGLSIGRRGDGELCGHGDGTGPDCLREANQLLPI